MTNAVDIAAVASYVNSNGVNSISTTSGALTVAGGVGITGNTYVGGTINGAGTGLTGTASSLSIGGNAGTATTLQTARNINGVSFNGSADITITAAAGTLTGTTLNATVVTSSLTSVGTITTGVWNAGAITSSGQIRSSSNFISTSTGPATTGQFAAVSGNTFISLYNDGSNGYILKSATSPTAFDTHRPFYVNLASGAVTLDGTGTGGVSVGGFLGVGITASSSYKLDINGKGRFVQDMPATTGAVILRSNSGDTVGGHLQWVNNANTDELGYIAINPSKVMKISTAGNAGITLFSNGNVNINSATDFGYKLYVNGSFAATTKSFVIKHPTKPNMRLRYGSLEGPENGVYVRGKLNGDTIELPDYWTKLVDPDSITVNLTPIGSHQKLYVKDIVDNKILIGNENIMNKNITCFYTVFAERCDVDKLEVEIY